MGSRPLVERSRRDGIERRGERIAGLTLDLTGEPDRAGARGDGRARRRVRKRLQRASDGIAFTASNPGTLMRQLVDRLHLLWLTLPLGILCSSSPSTLSAASRDLPGDVVGVPSDAVDLL